MKLLWVVCVVGVCGCVADVETEGEPEVPAIDALGYDCTAACYEGYDRARKYCDDEAPTDRQDDCLIAARGGFKIRCVNAPPTEGCSKPCERGQIRFGAFCSGLPTKKIRERCYSAANEAYGNCVNRGSMGFTR